MLLDRGFPAFLAASCPLCQSRAKRTPSRLSVRRARALVSSADRDSPTWDELDELEPRDSLVLTVGSTLRRWQGTNLLGSPERKGRQALAFHVGQAAAERGRVFLAVALQINVRLEQALHTDS